VRGREVSCSCRSQESGKGKFVGVVGMKSERKGRLLEVSLLGVTCREGCCRFWSEGCGIRKGVSGVGLRSERKGRMLEVSV